LLPPSNLLMKVLASHLVFALAA